MNSAATLDQTFAALADPTRRAILARLALGDATVNELAEPFAISQPAISRHLKVLESAGLIEAGRDAQRRPRRLVGRPLGEVHKWLEQYRRFWEEGFSRLDELLEEMQQRKPREANAPAPAGKARGRSAGRRGSRELG
jgi:DNA-binding transcriptional ArsR family regulator